MEQPKDEDGVVACLLPVLAQRVARHGRKPSPFCDCLIPPTISFAYQIKAFWYYIKRDDPGKFELRTQLKSELGNEKIIAGFEADDMMLGGSYAPQSDILAVYIRSAREQDAETGVERVVTMFDYMNKQELGTFLYAPPKSRRNNGILQRFVESAGEWNSVIRCTWSPRHVEVVRRRSLRPLAPEFSIGLRKKLQGYHHRTATFEGPDVLSCDMPLSGDFPRRVILEKTEAIVFHLQSAVRVPAEVAQIQLFFKVDRLDRVWLMYRSTLRLFKVAADLTVLVTPVPLQVLLLRVPFGERDGVFLGTRAAPPGGQEGLEISVEEDILANEAKEEKESDQSHHELGQLSGPSRDI